MSNQTQQKYIYNFQKFYPVEILEQKSNYVRFRTYFFGPFDNEVEKQTPFSKKLFECYVTLTDKFPQVSPSIGVTPHAVYHPNIDFDSGSVCVNVLNDKYWSNQTQIIEVIETVLPSLIVQPNPSDPLNPEAAKLFNENQQKYYEIAALKCKEKDIKWKNIKDKEKLPQYFKDKCQNYNLIVEEQKPKVIQIKPMNLRDDDDIGL